MKTITPEQAIVELTTSKLLVDTLLKGVPAGRYTPITKQLYKWVGAKKVAQVLENVGVRYQAIKNKRDIVLIINSQDLYLAMIFITKLKKMNAQELSQFESSIIVQD